MALKPLLKLKVDELFLRWLSKEETQIQLKEHLGQIQRGETVTFRPRKEQSQRPKPSSPMTPPASPHHLGKVTSPRSPRRVETKLFSKASKEEKFGQEKFLINLKDPQSSSNVTRESSRICSHQGVTTSLNKFTATNDSLPHSPKLPAKTSELSSIPQQISKIDHRTSSSASLSNSVSLNSSNTRASSFSSDETAESARNEHPVDDNFLSGSGDFPALKKAQARSVGAIYNRKSPVAVPKSSTIVPQFYFPRGVCNSSKESEEQTMAKISHVFCSFPGSTIKRQDMAVITDACGLPLYWKYPLFLSATSSKQDSVNLQQFLTMWRQLSHLAHDDAAKFVMLLAKPGSDRLVFDDFFHFVQDMVDTHPGLNFLQDAPEFHSRYIQTVIARIFFCIDRSWKGYILARDIRRSNLLATIQLLEEEDDINQITDYFSYEHFYVIYCKFWDLDTDHDLLISRTDLAKHNEHTISSRMIDRIMSGTVTHGPLQREGKMTYCNFVWFLLAEEDKKHPTSIEYWFRCMDLDGDGLITMYEMEYFYQEQVNKLEALGIETLPFEDCLCQMLDMIKPKNGCSISLGDLKASMMATIFFDTFFNLEKYLDHEQKDPFANLHDPDEPESSDWERFAAEEYELLVAEEGAQEEKSIRGGNDGKSDDEEELVPVMLEKEPLRLSGHDMNILKACSPESFT